MIRLTVLYNLAPSIEEDEFIAWRCAKRRNYVNSMPGVIRNEFSRIEDVSPNDVVPDYRYQTIVDWPDRETFEMAFHNENAQNQLRDHRKRIGDQVFIVSEILSS